ncbi:MAG: anaerobic sulfatase maturase [Clostridia bacterium]|jgi:uncharacterized protein|nr:anaerobic sulfatase maturase [Clostridia bacterium]
MIMDKRTYAMLAKPASSACNLRCEYCYYTGKKERLHVENSRMPQGILEAYTRQSLAMHGSDAVVEFAWHGGEPTIAGIPFFEEALRLQREYGKGRKILNTLQTNATLLTDAWCQFFKANNFLIGVSIDGPEPLHNVYRLTADGRGSFTETIRGIELLQRHGVSFNTLTTVNRKNMEKPLEVYRFLREFSDYMQFLPVVERMPAQYETEEGQPFATPPGLHSIKIKHPLADFSVTPEGYGAFLCAIWDEWKKYDSMEKHIQLFDVTIGNLNGIPSSLCVHNPLCGHSGCVEANGDVYSCDRYAFPAYKLGNLTLTSLGVLMEKNRDFGMHKTYGLPEECFDCRYIKLCFGGCPKDRLWDNKNYLCAGYKMFFDKVCNSTER